ncbi:MAG TPA: ABC transporter permease subunit/CPBP intramembrane protease [Lacipirellulaceae bacterium]
MNQEVSQLAELAPRDRRQMLGRLRRLVVKELREILRDRRTIITLVVMPLLIYPLLAVVFQRFLVTSIAINEDITYIIGVDSDIAKEILSRQLEEGDAALAEAQKRRAPNVLESFEIHQKESHAPKIPQGPAASADPTPEWIVEPFSTEDLKRHVIDSSLHLVVLMLRDSGDKPENGLKAPTRWELVYRDGSPTSEAALHFVEARLQAYNEMQLDRQLREQGVVIALPAGTTRHPVSFSGAPVFSLAALIPLILVLMTVTGAVYPAIDLTAGERERGTLETLIAAPVPRIGLLMAKYVAVLAVALLTALVNLAGMTITAHSTGLAASLFGGGMTLAVVVKVLLLLALFAAFFSAILLALTSCARSFKEAQAYIIPLMLVCLVPGVLCLLPSLEFAGWMGVTPLVNIVMLARDLLEGTVKTELAVAAVLSTALYVVAAIALAARIFGTDAILYGSQQTWTDLVRRPATPQRAAGLPGALLALALIFSCFFTLGTGLARSTEIPIERQLIVRALITAIVFGGIPIALATFLRLRWTTGLGLSRAHPLSFVAAVLLGLSVWPVAHEVFLLSEELGLTVMGLKEIAAAKYMIQQLRAMPLGLVLVTLAVVPAVFEELCFRGFLVSSLRTVVSAGWAAVLAAVLFGLFHEVISPGRLMTSTFIGLVLGWMRVRTGSVLPCIVLHAVHNSLLLSINHWQTELAAQRWGVEEQAHLPIEWMAMSALGIVVGVGLLLASSVLTDRDPSESSSTG